MPIWAIPNTLARAERPGFDGPRMAAVDAPQVHAWVANIQAMGIRSIICLLGPDELLLYRRLGAPLVDYYRAAGFEVVHVSVYDHQNPPLSPDDLDEVWRGFSRVSKPVLVHCSAGISRTGAAVQHIEQRLTG